MGQNIDIDPFSAVAVNFHNCFRCDCFAIQILIDPSLRYSGPLSVPWKDAQQSRLTDWLRVQLRWVTVPSWLLSAVFHLLLAGLLVVLSQMPSCRGDLGGEKGEAFRDVGIHLRPSLNDADHESESETDEQSAEIVYENPLTVSEPEQQNLPPVELSLPRVEMAPPVIGAGNISLPNSLAANDLLQPNNVQRSRSASTAAGGTVAGGTSFLGIEDVGRRFVYVIDRSFSMDNDGALQAAKAELQASLTKLTETQQFQIIFYSNDFEVLQPRDGRFDMFWGTDAQRMQVSGKLSAIRAQGGTRHRPALLKALEGNPDVIYLLTDGAAESALSAAELKEVRQRNRSGTRIHCIEFGRGTTPLLDGEANFLRQLAKQNQGQYVYRNVGRKR